MARFYAEETKIETAVDVPKKDEVVCAGYAKNSAPVW